MDCLGWRCAQHHLWGLGKARELTKQLKAHSGRSSEPVWVAVQNRGEDELDQYWVGRALRVEKVYTEPGSVAGTTGRVRYDVGDCEIAVHWFQRDVSGGSERRTFKLWAADEGRRPTLGQWMGKLTLLIRRSYVLSIHHRLQLEPFSWRCGRCQEWGLCR